MFLYFTPLIDMLSTEENSIRGNMKPLYPRPTLLVPEAGVQQRKAGLNKTKTKRQIKNVTLL